MDLAPSSDSRMMSAWPACCAVSAMMCSRTWRADHCPPAGCHGALGSGCVAFRSGSVQTALCLNNACDVNIEKD